MMLDLGNADLALTDFFYITCQIFHMLLLLQILKKFGFSQIYLNTKLFFSWIMKLMFLVNEYSLGLLPWLHMGLLFLPPP